MIGQTISRYKIIEKLGSGGMGIVYKAEDLTLKRAVALKFLSPELTKDAAARERFVQEARAASALQHSNICTIHEIAETEDGQIFICMDYYQGKTLEKIIEGAKQIALNEIVQIATQIFTGLSHAHESGIIHRDIKPGNIMITDQDEVKILDFGLAKLSGQSKLTRTGSTVGTVAYMSPEQTRGEMVNIQSDIWSVGVLLYEMICGQRPFTGEYEHAVMYAIMNEDPVPADSINKNCPHYVSDILSKCLQKKETDRYSSAEEIISELKSGSAERSHDAVRRSARYSRVTMTVLIVLVSVIILISASVFLYKQWTESQYTVFQDSSSPWIASLAVLPFKNLSSDKEQEYFCDGMTEQIITNLSQLKDLKIISRTSVMKFKDGFKTVPEIAQILNVRYILEGSVRKSEKMIRVTAQLIDTESDFHMWAKDFDQQLINIFAIQDTISNKIANALLENLPFKEKKKLTTKHTPNIEAYEYFLKGRYYHEYKFLHTQNREDWAVAERMFKKAIELDPEFTVPYTALADLYFSANMTASGEENRINTQLQKYYLNRSFSLDSTISYSYLVQGRIYDSENEPDKAFRSFQKALQMNPSNAWYNRTIGNFLINKGLVKQGLHFVQQAIELDPLQAAFYHSSGLAYMFLGNFVQAEHEYKKGLQLNPDMLFLLEDYAHLLLDTKRFAETLKILDHLHSLGKNVDYIRARYYAAQGDVDTALNLARTADVYAILNMPVEFLSIFESQLPRYAKSGTSIYYFLQTNPRYDNVRMNPRFRKVLAHHKNIYENNLRKYGTPFE